MSRNAPSLPDDERMLSPSSRMGYGNRCDQYSLAVMVGMFGDERHVFWIPAEHTGELRRRFQRRCVNASLIAEDQPIFCCLRESVARKVVEIDDSCTREAGVTDIEWQVQWCPTYRA